jgi:hypothetical protein
MSPPSDVKTMIEAWTRSAAANASSVGSPIASATLTAASSYVPR